MQTNSVMAKISADVVFKILNKNEDEKNLSNEVKSETRS